MNTFRLLFDHPVKGDLCLKPLSGQAENKPCCQPFDTGTGCELTIPLSELEEGQWELVLNWEHEERSFQHIRQFEIAPASTLFRTSKYADACLYHSRQPLYTMHH